MAQIKDSHFQTEDDVIAFVEAWNQEDVTAIPTFVTSLYPELLECNRVASSVPVELRGVCWMPSNGSGSTQNGCEVMAVDAAAFALVRCITWWEHEDVDHSTYAIVPLTVAKELRKTHSEPSPHKVHEIGLAADYGPQSIAFDSASALAPQAEARGFPRNFDEMRIPNTNSLCQ